jgi:hypothetical protein
LYTGLHTTSHLGRCGNVGSATLDHHRSDANRPREQPPSLPPTRSDRRHRGTPSTPPPPSPHRSRPSQHPQPGPPPSPPRRPTRVGPSGGRGDEGTPRTGPARDTWNTEPHTGSNHTAQHAAGGSAPHGLHRPLRAPPRTAPHRTPHSTPTGASSASDTTPPPLESLDVATPPPSPLAYDAAAALESICNDEMAHIRVVEALCLAYAPSQPLLLDFVGCHRCLGRDLHDTAPRCRHRCLECVRHDTAAARVARRSNAAAVAAGVRRRRSAGVYLQR